MKQDLPESASSLIKFAPIYFHRDLLII